MAETYDSLMKIVIIGDTSVGKTCLIMRYTHDTFRESFLSTIGKLQIELSVECVPAIGHWWSAVCS